MTSTSRKTVPFDIYLPATPARAARKMTTIQIEVETDDSGNEWVTPESTVRIDAVQSRFVRLHAAQNPHLQITNRDAQDGHQS